MVRYGLMRKSARLKLVDHFYVVDSKYRNGPQYVYRDGEIGILQAGDILAGDVNSDHDINFMKRQLSGKIQTEFMYIVQDVRDLRDKGIEWT